jgi:hypothetical protein
MARRPPQPASHKPANRKVIKLDLTSMLEDETLSGDRQLSALQVTGQTPEPLEDVLDQVHAQPVKMIPGSFVHQDPGPVLNRVDPENIVNPETSPEEPKTSPGMLLKMTPGVVLPNKTPGPVLQANPGSVLIPNPVTKTGPGVFLPIRLRPIRTVQDGLHAGEMDLLQFLWSEGTPDPTDTGIRTLSLGNAAIRRRSIPGSHELGRSTVKRLLKTLGQKRCIYLQQEATVRTAAVYEVYSFQRILETWRSLGWSQVYRDRRAVTLAGISDTGIVLQTDPGFVLKTNPAVIFQTDPEVPGVKTGPGSRAKVSPDPGFKVSPHNKELIETPIKELRTSTMPAAWSLWCLEQHIDSASARQIWNACLAVCPDVEAQEAIHFADHNWQRLQRNPEVQYPARVLALSLPNFLTGEVFDQYRQLQSKVREQQRREEIRFYMAVRENPEDFAAELVEEAGKKLQEWGVPPESGSR